MKADAKPWLLRALGRSGFLGRYPAYASVVAGLQVVDNPDIDVMAVSFDGAFQLHVNTGFFAAQPQFIDGVLLHVIHHIVYDHVGLTRRLDPVFPQLLQIAKECSANEFITEPLPGEPIRWEQFAHLGLCAGQSTLERYDLLCEARRAGRLRDADPGLVDDHRFMENDDDAAANPDDVTAALVILLRASVQMTGSRQDGTAVTLAGRNPGDLLREISAILPTPITAIDWRKVLKAPQRRVLLADPRWPNRRFPDRLGQVPGRRRRSVTRPMQVLAAIDTSASMGAADLAAVAAQIGRLALVAAVTVVECDVVVQRVYRYEGRLPDVTGGGGTDLRPVFEAAFLAAHAPDAVVYFTDGDGPHPVAAPAVRTIWVLTDDQAFACAWGTRLRLHAPDGRRG